MNRIFKILSFLFGSAFIIFIFLTIGEMVKTPLISRNGKEAEKILDFHYAFFLPASDHSFFVKVREGAVDAAKTAGCAITFHLIDSNPTSFELAGFSGFDGFGVYLYKEDKRKLEILEGIISEGFPVVQIENDVIQGAGSFFVGTNNFNVGKAIGQLARTIKLKSLNMVLVYSEKNPGLISDKNLIKMGIKSVLGDKLSELRTEETSLNPLDAEMLVNKILNRYPSTDVIVLTDPNDTLVTVQAIIDMNLVGMVKIIGFGEQETIKSFIEKGVILGSIIRNPYKIGYSAVMALRELSLNGNTSAYIDSGISVLKSQNQ